jgi:hypothetical protein
MIYTGLYCVGLRQRPFRRVRKIAKILASSCPSIRPPAWNFSAPTGLIFMKFDIVAFFENIEKNNGQFT